MTSIPTLACSAIAGTAVCLLVSEALLGNGLRIRRRISRARQPHVGGSSDGSSLFRADSVLGLQRNSLGAGLQRFLEQSGAAVTLSRFLGASGALGGLGLLIALCLAGNWLTIFGIASLFAALPLFVIAWMRKRRTERMRRQLPEAFDIMSRSVQAGQTIASAMQVVAAECRQPLAREFANCCDQQNLGLGFEAALQDLARRVPIVELRILAIALIVQRQTGGNPVEVINNLSDLIRKRMKLTQRLKTLTGEGRMQAAVLILLPILMFVGLRISRPEYVQSLIDHPRLLGAVVWAQILGSIWIHRITRLDF